MKHNDRINNKSKPAFAVMGVSGVNLEVDVYTHQEKDAGRGPNRSAEQLHGTWKETRCCGQADLILNPNTALLGPQPNG